MTAEFEHLAVCCRRWRLAAIALALALMAAAAINARADLPYPERLRARTVEASEVVLRDDAGRVRARLAIQNGAAQLTILDEHGKVVASVPERARVVPVR